MALERSNVGALGMMQKKCAIPYRLLTIFESGLLLIHLPNGQRGETSCGPRTPGPSWEVRWANSPDSLQTFGFAGDAAGNLIDDEQIVVNNLSPGHYSVTETLPAGWELTDILCNDSDSSGELTTATATFELDAGESLTCTFVNSQMEAPLGVPIFSLGGTALIVLMMMVIAAVFMRYSRLI